MRHDQSILQIIAALYDDAITPELQVVTAVRHAGSKTYGNAVRHDSALALYNYVVNRSDEAMDVCLTPFLFDKNNPRRTKAAAMYTRAVWLDIDVRANEPDKGTFITDEDAYNTLYAWCAEYGIPIPSILVSTGGGRGYHAYWLFDKWMNAKEYEDVGNMLRSILLHAAQHGTYAPQYKMLSADMTRLSDAASIMRVAGTYNTNTQTPSFIIADASPMTVNDYAVTCQHLVAVQQYHSIATINPNGATTTSTTQVAGLDDVNVRDAAVLVMGGCELLRFARDNQNAVPEPAWRNILGASRFLAGGNKWAHDMSKDYDGYDPAELEMKMAGYAVDAPPTCATFESSMQSGVCAASEICGRCAYSAHVGSKKGGSTYTSSFVNCNDAPRASGEALKAEVFAPEVIETIDYSSAGMSYQPAQYPDQLQVETPDAIADDAMDIPSVPMHGLTEMLSIGDALGAVMGAVDSYKKSSGAEVMVGDNSEIYCNGQIAVDGFLWVSNLCQMLSGEKHPTQICELSYFRAGVVRRYITTADTLQSVTALAAFINGKNIPAQAGASIGRAIRDVIATTKSACATRALSRNIASVPNVAWFNRRDRLYNLFGTVISADGISETPVAKILMDDDSKVSVVYKNYRVNPNADMALLRQAWDAYSSVTPQMRVMMYMSIAAVWLPIHPEASCKGLWVHLNGKAGTGKTTMLKLMSAAIVGDTGIKGSSGSHAARVNMHRAAGSMPLVIDEISAISGKQVMELAYAGSEGGIGDKASVDGKIRSTGYYAAPPNTGAMTILTSGNISIRDKLMQDRDVTDTQMTAIDVRTFDFTMARADRPELDANFINGQMQDLINNKYGAMLLPTLMCMITDPDALSESIAQWTLAIRLVVERDVQGIYSAYRVIGGALGACLAACAFARSQGMTDDDPNVLVEHAASIITDMYNVQRVKDMESEGTANSGSNHGRIIRDLTAVVAHADSEGCMVHNGGITNLSANGNKPIVGEFIYGGDDKTRPIGAYITIDAVERGLTGRNGIYNRMSLQDGLAALSVAGQVVQPSQYGGFIHMHQLSGMATTIAVVKLVYDAMDSTATPVVVPAQAAVPSLYAVQ